MDEKCFSKQEKVQFKPAVVKLKINPIYTAQYPKGSETEW